MDLIDDPQPGENAHEFTVAELSGAVKRVIEGEFGRVRVKGELGRVTIARSGHIYTDLKDDRAVLSSVIWKGQAARLAVRPEEGMEVVATGRLTTFPGQSRYQLVIDDIRPAGVGALMALLEKRRKALETEGLFDAARKKPLPYLPEVIGVVTSPTGAVIRDILHRLRDRFPRQVLIWPVAVQGDRCAPEVTNAINGFNALPEGGSIPRPDLIIVARGGGSIEDLWGFNEESVVRAAAASEIPLISAVGHETDTTLIDHAADRRAPTPTAAAEMAVPVRLELAAWLDEQEARLSRALSQGVSRRRQRTEDLARALPRPEALLFEPRQKLDGVEIRLPRALLAVVSKARQQLAEKGGAIRPSVLRSGLRTRNAELARTAARLTPDLLERRRSQMHKDFDDLAGKLSLTARRQFDALNDRLSALERMRQTLGYRETLRRGYAVVWAGDVLVPSKADLPKGQPVEVEFHDGRAQVGGGTTAKPTSRKRENPSDQGSLF